MLFEYLRGHLQLQWTESSNLKLEWRFHCRRFIRKKNIIKQQNMTIVHNIPRFAKQNSNTHLVNFQEPGQQR